MTATATVDLAYEVRGAGPPLVLIMGLGAARDAWEPHVQAYERHFTCYAVDNRGAGESPKPEGPYSTAAMADDYAQLIRRLDVGAVGVVGISMGGAIGQELALRHPELVSRLVIVASWAACDAYTSEVFRHFEAVRAVSAPEDFMRLLQLWIWTPRYVSEHLAELEEARRAPATMPQHAFAAQCAACIGHDARDRLGDLGVPTLITAGDEDIFTPLRLAQELHERIPGAELQVLPGTGHAHHWEALDECNDLTTEWLR